MYIYVYTHTYIEREIYRLWLVRTTTTLHISACYSSCETLYRCMKYEYILVVVRIKCDMYYN